MSEPAGSVKMRAGDSFEAFGRLMGESWPFRRSLSSRGSDAWMPPTDVYETCKEIVIKMSVPGVKPEDVRIVCEGQIVTISGYRDASPGPGVVAYHQMEIRHGYFERKLIFQKPVDPESACAEYRDGFIYVRFPKAEAPVNRVLRIRIRL